MTIPVQPVSKRARQFLPAMETKRKKASLLYSTANSDK